MSIARHSRPWARVAPVLAALVAAGCYRNIEWVEHGPSELDGGDPSEGDPEVTRPVVVHSLIVNWASANTVRWGWEAEGSPDRLVRYELVVGESAQQVEERAAGVTVYGPDERPELGGFYLPRTASTEPVMATTSTDHLPLTEYFARLEAVDSTGSRAMTNVASARTGPPPRDELVVFEDALAHGYASPPEFVLSSAAPYSGTAHFEYTHHCEGQRESWENLRLRELALSLESILEGDFNTSAFLELAIAYEAVLPAYFAEVGLCMGAATDLDDEFVSWPWTLAVDDRYHVIQIPLRAFARQGPGGRSLTHADLAAGLSSLRIGALWSEGGHVRVDAVKVRW